MDFLVIGAPKAGTTWLCNMLKEHPEIYIPPIKELCYFNNKSLYKWGDEVVPDILYLMNEALLVSLIGFATCGMFLSLNTHEVFYYLMVLINYIYVRKKQWAMTQG